MQFRISALSRAAVRVVLALALIATAVAPSVAQWRGVNPIAPTWVTYTGGNGAAENPVIIDGPRNVREVLEAALGWISNNRTGWQAGTWTINGASLFTVEISKTGEAPTVVHFDLRNFRF